MRHVPLSSAIKNDEWIDAIDPEVGLDELPEIPGYHVLVRPFSVKEKTKSGIYIKPEVEEITHSGIVRYISDSLKEMGVNVNDKVVPDTDNPVPISKNAVAPALSSQNIIWSSFGSDKLSTPK